MASRKTVPIKTIADAARVSSSTVSLVLNNRGTELRISPETQNRILKIASDFGYFDRQSSPLSSIDRPGQRALDQVIVFVTNDFQNIPFSRFNTGLKEYAKASAVPVDWVYHSYDADHLCDYRMILSSAYYQGAIITTPSMTDADFLTKTRFDIPIVLYNYQINGYTCICHDDYDIGRQAADAFLRLGKNKIGIVLPENPNRGISLRLAGFTSHLSAHKFSTENYCIASGPCKDRYSGYLATSKILEKNFVPSAIYVINDLMTEGVINRLKQERLRIPDDVVILSYGDTDSQKTIPSVSSYISESEKMAYTCFEQLMLEIKGGATSGRYFSFGTECIWRESCPSPY